MTRGNRSGSNGNKENTPLQPETTASGRQGAEEPIRQGTEESTDDESHPPSCAQPTKLKRGQGLGKKKKEPQPSKSTKTVWTSSDNAKLIDALLDARAAGHQSDSGFKSIAYTACAQALSGSEKSSGGIAKDASACSNHWGKLKRDFAAVKKLRDHSGFGWDDENNLVTASAEVRGAAIKANYKVAVWQKKPFPLYDNIAILVDQIMATGELAFRPGQPRHEEDESSISLSSDEEFSEGDLQTQQKSTRKRARASTTTTFTSSASIPRHTHKSRSGSPPEKKKRRHTRPSSPRQGTRNNAASISAVADSIQAMAASFKPPDEMGADRLQQAIAILEDDQALSDNEAADAVALFSSSTSIARAFSMTKSKSLRTSFIQRAIRQAADREFQARRFGSVAHDRDYD